MLRWISHSRQTTLQLWLRRNALRGGGHGLGVVGLSRRSLTTSWMVSASASASRMQRLDMDKRHYIESPTKKQTKMAEAREVHDMLQVVKAACKQLEFSRDTERRVDPEEFERACGRFSRLKEYAKTFSERTDHTDKTRKIADKFDKEVGDLKNFVETILKDSCVNCLRMIMPGTNLCADCDQQISQLAQTNPQLLPFLPPYNLTPEQEASDPQTEKKKS